MIYYKTNMSSVNSLLSVFQVFRDAWQIYMYTTDVQVVGGEALNTVLESEKEENNKT